MDKPFDPLLKLLTLGLYAKTNVVSSDTDWSASKPGFKGRYAQFILNSLPFDQISHGKLHVSYAGMIRHFTGPQEGTQADLILHKPLRFLWSLFRQGDLGVASAYAEGIIDTPSLYHLLLLGKQNEASLNHAFRASKGMLKKLQSLHASRHNSVENSRQNISEHYDLGNDFYQLWLDPSMTYSSAIFKPDARKSEALIEAQHRKYQRLLQQIDAKPQDRILEVGCGWGGFAEMAAKAGCQVTGITLSKEQHDFAKGRLHSQNLNGEIKLIDYRHQTGQFDHIVSIEMFEAVGKEYWHQYFSKVDSLLKPGGRLALQIITIDEKYADDYQQSVDFIQRYIFPGGLLPSPSQIRKLAEFYGLEPVNEFAFGQDYAETLQRWLTDFDRHERLLDEMGYDQRFRKLWRYYLDYCRVGFDTQHINVYHFTYQKPCAQNADPTTLATL